MAAQRKAILSCGLGRFAANDPNAQAHFGPDAANKTRELLETSIKKANQAGFYIVTIDANPQDPEDTLKRFAETMRGQDFAGVNIGYGVRGHKGTGDAYEVGDVKQMELIVYVGRSYGAL